jgi:hypothetical protein
VAGSKSSRTGLGNLRGGFLVEVFGWSLGMGGCGENVGVVVLENVQPCRDTGGVVLAQFLVQFEVGAVTRGVKGQPRYQGQLQLASRLCPFITAKCILAS